MTIWQADFYKYSAQGNSGNVLWKLLICDSQGNLIHQANCSQSQANSDWLVSQLRPLIQKQLPDLIQVFRPQSLSLLTIAAGKLGIKVIATRRTFALKEILKKQTVQEHDNPIKLEKLPPQPLPENLWGEGWRFASFPAGELVDYFCDRQIPIINIPEELLPLKLGIASSESVPGMVIYGGRKSLYLSRWLEEMQPVSLNYIPTEIGASGGLILEAGLADRWIIATFEDREVAQAAQNYEQRKQASKGLHFLLVQPDDSGITYSGFWLLQAEEI